ALVYANVGIRVYKRRILNHVTLPGGIDIQPVIAAKQPGQVLLLVLALNHKPRCFRLLVVRQHKPDFLPVFEKVLLEQRNYAVTEDLRQGHQTFLTIRYLSKGCKVSMADAVVSVIKRLNALIDGR